MNAIYTIDLLFTMKTLKHLTQLLPVIWGVKNFNLGKTMLLMNSSVVLNCISNTDKQKAKLNNFIGHTSNTDRHWLICHLSKLADNVHIVHYKQQNTTIIIRKKLIDNTKILYMTHCEEHSIYLKLLLLYK